MTRYWHGGIPGLRPGDLISPHPPNAVDGCPICAAKAAGIDTAIDPLTKHPDRIYLTTDRTYARFYASKYPLGDLYVVRPVGEVERSTEDHWPTWMAEAAEVVQAYELRVQLTPGQRRTLFSRWGRLDQAVREVAS